MDIRKNTEQRIKELEKAIGFHQVEAEKQQIELKKHQMVISNLRQQLTRAKNLYNQIKRSLQWY